MVFIVVGQSSEAAQSLTQCYVEATAPKIQSLDLRLEQIEEEFQTRKDNGDNSLEIHRPILEAIKEIWNGVKEMENVVRENTTKIDDSITKIKKTIDTFFEDVGL